MDRLQLCTQAIALEEMFDCNIDKGYLFYHEIARREEVEFSEALRKQVESAFQEMHAYYEKSYTPKVKPSAKCKRCSLQNICLPEIANKESVNTYIKRKLHEEAEDEKLNNILYITSPDAYLSLDGETVKIQIGDDKEKRIPFHNLEGIITFGYAGASPGLMHACAQRNIALTFLSSHGRFLARVNGEQYGNVVLRKNNIGYLIQRWKVLPSRKIC